MLSKVLKPSSKTIVQSLVSASPPLTPPPCRRETSAPTQVSWRESSTPWTPTPLPTPWPSSTLPPSSRYLLPHPLISNCQGHRPIEIQDQAPEYNVTNLSNGFTVLTESQMFPGAVHMGKWQPPRLDNPCRLPPRCGHPRRDPRDFRRLSRPEEHLSEDPEAH